MTGPTPCTRRRARYAATPRSSCAGLTLPVVRVTAPLVPRLVTRRGQLAEQSGENALARLLGMFTVSSTGLMPETRLRTGEADGVADWSQTDGSTSFARGLVRLIVARSNAWQETGATLAALRGLDARPSSCRQAQATAEMELADRAYVDLVDRLNFRRASAVLLAADTADAVGRLGASPADPLDWLRAAELAMSLDRATEAIADPDLKAVAATRLAEVDAAAASLASDPDTIDVARAVVHESARRAETLVLRYRGRRAQDAGFRDEAVSLRQQALARAEEQGDQVYARRAAGRARPPRRGTPPCRSACCAAASFIPTMPLNCSCG